jgi:hypothetical protein
MTLDEFARIVEDEEAAKAHLIRMIAWCEGRPEQATRREEARRAWVKARAKTIHAAVKITAEGLL